MKLVNFSILLVKLTILLSLFSVEINAQNAGSLDQTFGSGGFIATRLFESATLFDIAIQPDGKIIAVGNTFDPMRVVTVGMVARFNQNGTLDTTFSGDGFNNAGFMKEISSVVILPDGKIMVGGYVRSNITSRFSIARLNSDGSLDTTFDGDGQVETTVGYGSSINSIKVLPNGKILAVGLTLLTTNSNRDIAMVRYNADGSLDTTFGSGGRVASNFGFDEFANDCAIQSDGKIIVVGYYIDPLPNEMVALIARYNVDGSVDTTFGNNGKVSRPGGPRASANEVAIQSDGKILIAGSDIPLTRYNFNGTHDIDFITPAGSSGSTVEIQSDGKILTGGNSSSGNNPVIVRFNINGSLDNSFGIGGAAATVIYATAMAIAPDGKIVVGGTRFNSNFELVLARHLNDSTGKVSSMDFDGDGKSDFSIYRPSVGEWWYLRSSDGGNAAVQFGTSTDKIVPADYTGDGKTDFAFYRKGEWFILRSEDFSYYAFPFGLEDDIPVPADYDGDGKSDPAVFRPSTSVWYILQSSGGVRIEQFGSGGKPVPADYDGDKRADLAVYNALTNQFRIRYAASEATLAIFVANGSLVSAADYTGDNAADIAFYNPSTNAWRIIDLRGAVESFVQFGSPGDIPAPGDYDGDGKTDIAIYRPSTSDWWYAASSANGQQRARQFGISTDIPVPSAFIP